MKHLHTRLNRILNYVTAALIIVLLLSLALPYFNYPGGEIKDTCSMASFVGFPQNFEHLTEDVIGLKNISIKQLYVPIATIIFGIIVTLICIFKSGLPVAIISTLYSAAGVVFYLINDFMSYANMYGKWVTFAIFVVILAASIVSMVAYINELKNRKEEDFISLIDG